MNWTVYIAQCRDGSFYTGITTDPERRLAEHNSGCGGAYTRSKMPVVMVYREPAANRSGAQQRERAIKRLNRAQKEELVAGSKRNSSYRAPEAGPSPLRVVLRPAPAGNSDSELGESR